jgi:hypothetical protein
MEAQIEKRDGRLAGFRIGGYWGVVCRGKDGREKWREYRHNLVTNQGLNHILDVVLHGATQITAWYVAPFNTNTTILATHTYAAPGYTESSNYDEATRQAYNEAAASGQSITNSANKATITCSETETVYGCGLVGGGSAATTKGNTDGGGTLLCAVLFSTARSVVDGDTLEITYTISAADDGS